VIVDYKEGSSKVVKFDVDMLDSSGYFIGSAGKKDLSDYSGHDGFSIISDYRLKHIRAIAETYPISLVVSYEIESKNTLSIPLWFPMWQSKVAVENSSVEIIKESDIDIRVNENQLKEYGIKKLGECHYECKDLKAFRNEAHSPSSIEYLPWVEFRPTSFTFESSKGTIVDWHSYGKYFYNTFLADQNNVDPSILKEDLKNVVDPSSTKEEIVAQLYKFVQDNTRYISISLDEGGFQPLSTEDVHQNKYGDCKALSFYMMALLEQYEIESNYIEVYAGSKRPRSLNNDFASPLPGNHIIINVPMGQDTMWLDCTSSLNPVNYLGRFTDNRYVVEIKKEGGKMVKTPSYDDISYVEENAVAVLDKEGNLSMELECNSVGHAMDDVFYLKELEKDALDENLIRDRYAHLSNPKLKSYQQTLSSEELKITETINLTSKAYAELAGEYFMVPCHLSKSSLPRIKSKRARKFPIEFHRKIFEKRKYKFIVPSDFVFPNQVKADKIESKYGIYTYKIEQNNEGELLVESELQIHKGLYDPSEIKEIKSFLSKVKKQQNVQIILKHK